MRLPRDVGDDSLLHAALLAYASDYLLLDMAFRSHPQLYTPAGFTGFSLDHAVWIHRPVRFDRWHLHTQETIAIAGHRGLIRGAIHDADGHLVASVVQEVLVRPTATENRR
jgi:acyl-CoA thioesterase-2